MLLHKISFGDTGKTEKNSHLKIVEEQSNKVSIRMDAEWCILQMCGRGDSWGGF